MINYIEEKTGKCAALSEQGEAAPYNGEPEYSINTDKTEKTGYRFSNLKDWIYELLDYYIEQVNKEIVCKNFDRNGIIWYGYGSPQFDRLGMGIGADQGE